MMKEGLLCDGKGPCIMQYGKGPCIMQHGKGPYIMQHGKGFMHNATWEGVHA